MAPENKFDVIIIGGSYSGLAAGMALGRALRKVLIIDNGKPCNRQTPHSHNFLTNDGKTPTEIAALANRQVSRYETVEFFNGLAVAAKQIEKGFQIQVATGETFIAKKLIFATGIRDILPAIDGFAACWGISVLHCPYCHGYEVRNEKTGIFLNGDAAFDFARLIANWTTDLTLFTNGPSSLSAEQSAKLESHHIKIIEKQIEKLAHVKGHLESIVFSDGTTTPLNFLYAPAPFEQHGTIPQSLGCELSEDGYIKVDHLQETTIKGIYAAGDNVSRMRTVANAVSMGTTAGIAISKKMILEEF
ncbi:NAD(P)/FAD-dependent oxidoreductase [Ferruginibacter paludis]|nr:NAD(P)/FAD-dependent oxidoreductase [Ferruginibacter paludis]MDN3654168.1 NAD(P)/FAD-dependent oxidoreductase [Ferruginibacter paludis]